MAWVGIAPHSVRAVPLHYLKEIIGFADERRWPIHMHVAEQPAEVSACIEEYGRSPVALLATEGLLSERFTGRACYSRHAESGADAGRRECERVRVSNDGAKSWRRHRSGG